MAFATDDRGNVIYRTTEMDIPVEEVQPGDLLFDIPVIFSEPHSDWIWSLTAETPGSESGITMLITKGNSVIIKRSVPLEENQCIDCGRLGVKYAAKRQCSACYQRKHREAARRNSSRPEQLRLLG